MEQKTNKKQTKNQRDEHELLEQENFRWLADFRDTLSPYWASRVEYQADKKAHVLVLDGTERNG